MASGRGKYISKGLHLIITGRLVSHKDRLVQGLRQPKIILYILVPHNHSIKLIKIFQVGEAFCLETSTQAVNRSFSDQKGGLPGPQVVSIIFDNREMWGEGVVCHSTPVEIKGQLCGLGSLLLPLHGFWPSCRSLVQ